MSHHPRPALSHNQQAMLDLALACDLKASDPSLHPKMKARHQAINTQQDAANYIREVETKIHSGRKSQAPRKTSRAAVASMKTSPNTAVKPPPITGGMAALILLLLVAGMGLAGWYFPNGWDLIGVTVCMVGVFILLGITITNNALGILVNDRNLMSLSRFQMAVWTLVVLAVFFTFAMMRIRAMAVGELNGQSFTDPLNITVDPHLWALLGISTTSLVGAPLILSTKKDKVPDDSVIQKTARMVDESPQAIMDNKQGTLYGNARISDARVTDMFQGDELTNAAQVDLAKVQMFFFTIIAAVCFYVMACRQLLEAKDALGSLPLLSEGFVVALLVSHGGYLGSKSINHTKSQS